VFSESPLTYSVKIRTCSLKAPIRVHCLGRNCPRTFQRQYVIASVMANHKTLSVGGCGLCALSSTGLRTKRPLSESTFRQPCASCTSFGTSNADRSTRVLAAMLRPLPPSKSWRISESLWTRATPAAASSTSAGAAHVLLSDVSPLGVRHALRTLLLVQL
jgi:hypothetical protein